MEPLTPEEQNCKPRCCIPSTNQLGGDDVFYTGPNLPHVGIITNDSLNTSVQKLAQMVLTGGYSDEQAQDAVGDIMLSTPSITLTYDDGLPQITASVVPSWVLNLVQTNPNNNYIQNQSATTQVATSRISGSQTAGSFTALSSSVILANRPTDAPVTNGALIYRSDTNKLRAVVAGAWQNIVTENLLPAPVNAILNQNASAQSANFWITGKGIAESGLIAYPGATDHEFASFAAKDPRTLAQGNIFFALQAQVVEDKSIMFLGVQSGVTYKGSFGWEGGTHNFIVHGGTPQSPAAGELFAVLRAGGVKLTNMTADPPAINGALVYRTDMQKFRGCVNGVWKTLVTEDAADNTILNIVTATAYTLLPTDKNAIISCTANSPITITVPTGLPTAFHCVIWQNGLGQITIVGSGTTLRQRQNMFRTIGQGSGFSVNNTALNFYNVQGDLQV